MLPVLLPDCNISMLIIYSPCDDDFFNLSQSTLFENIQLFRERLSEKVHATIPKGIVGGF